MNSLYHFEESHLSILKCQERFTQNLSNLMQDGFEKIYSDLIKCTFLFRFMTVTTSFSARSEEELDPEVIKEELDKSSKY